MIKGPNCKKKKKKGYKFPAVLFVMTLMGGAFQVYSSGGGNGFALMPPHFLCPGGNTTSPQDVAVSEEMVCDCRTVATLRGFEAGTPELGLKHPSVLTKWN